MRGSNNLFIQPLQTQDSLLLSEILSLLIIDEKRGAKDINDIELDREKQIPDYTWFHHKSIDTHGNIIDKEPNISINNILKYQIPKSDDKNSLYQQFMALERDDDESAIDAYNEVLEILKILSINTDEKTRQFIKALNTIGENNIKALYVGINDKENTNNNNQAPALLAGATTENNNEDENKKKRPKFIGRLATTIIIEDGLWLG
ncbi:hypothetical protein CQA53_10775 [Helicobacter didelphidarum]|uniref:Uncharacterized protein n=1 Tax=Helicobacter didelphidarum TaxID=2040648 RepID=A0A3D8I627_9HELI|nr:hypothetical protein CQA53_10775 [Helicobacter didelphidarum]